MATHRNVYPVYKTDAWHSYASRDLLGIATTKALAIKICKEKARREHSKIDADQLFNLNNISQTQGYAGEGEFHIDTVTTNTII